MCRIYYPYHAAAPGRMMIVPYGHEHSVRSLPWATAVIFVLCVVAFLLTNGSMARSDEEAGRLFSEIAERYLDNPNLELDPATRETLLQSLRVDENQSEVFLENLREQAVARSRRTEPGDQEELDSLVTSFWAAYRGSVAYRFGVVPDRLSGPSLITHQFLHGGWLHLIGNLLFLYLAAPLVEERWGTALFAAFYLLAGAVAALFWVARYPDLEVPLVGASGSIAGVMGAFVICFGASKIKFFYWFGIIWGRFEAPAWLMLPLWLVIEVLSGRAMDVAHQGQGGGGVAHWAHVWGFIFGAAFAAVATRLGVGAVPSPSVGAAGAQPRIDDPLLIGRAGRVDEGLSAPRAGAAPDPDDGRIPGELRRTPAATEPETGGAPVSPHPRTAAMPDGAPTPSAAAVGLRPAERLRVADGVPRALDDSALTVLLDRGRGRVPLRSLQGVAVAAIREDGRRPYLIVDLLLDSPWDDGAELRVVRLRSSAFDPRRLMGGDSAMASFRRLVETILERSAAAALPDEASVRDPGSRSFSSLESYQQEVLGVMG